MSDAPQPRRGLLRSVGPAIIIASVVLGPGSILANSRVGAEFGYGMIWLMLALGTMMVGMTALCARLGVTYEGTPCDEIRRRAGRPLAGFVGVAVFLIVACFQFSNNVAVIAALQPILPGDSKVLPVLILLALNGALFFLIFGFRHLYKPVETLMKVLVGVMMLAFAANLFFARPSIGEILGGIIPSVPEGFWASVMPKKVDNVLVDELMSLQAICATTFSVAGVFYQTYLVKQKGWTRDNLRQGLVDSVVGISVLILLSLMVMITAAAVLQGKKLGNVAEVGAQLQPLFGNKAVVLFSLGLLGGALSSFLVNVMIGGGILSDGLGLGGDMDQKWPRIFTAAALGTGMIVAILIVSAGFSPVALIIFAQAVTVLGNPVLAGVMLWLATRPDMTGERAVPLWIKILTGIGFVTVTALAVRLAVILVMRIV